jgi:hypothetical protein
VMQPTANVTSAQVTPLQPNLVATGQLRQDMQFQHQPTNAQSTQVIQASNQDHDTHAPTGDLARRGVYLCENHRINGGRTKFCRGNGCEWQQIYDPQSVANPNIQPLKSYGEYLAERENQGYNRNNAQGYGQGNYRPNGYNNNRGYGNGGYNNFNRGYNNFNGNRGFQGNQRYNNQNQPPPQQNQSTNNVQYYPPPQSANNVANVATSSGNGQGAPTPANGCQ